MAPTPDPTPIVQVRELPVGLSADLVFERLSALPYCLFLDSALCHPQRGRYSFVAADPFDVVVQTSTRQPTESLQETLDRFSAATIEGLPPFQGGLAGLFTYEWGRSFEDVPAARIDEFQLPLAVIGCYDVVAAFDHRLKQGWLISQGFPQTDPAARRERAVKRLEFIWKAIVEDNGPVGTDICVKPSRPVAPNELAPQYATELGRRITSTFRRSAYEAAVAQVIEYIRAGDVFQVNLSQRLLAPQVRPSRQLYLELRRRNPAPFAGYFDLGEFQILSASPERFLQLRGRTVHTHPIKGTRYRSPHVEADLFAADDLLASEKDRAENTMIVDLLRNDLSRVCRDDSIAVEKLCGLERYQFVQHLVSIIRAELNPSAGPLDLLAATFPGGSITGAPKIRAMEIIAELEPTVRGAYCGSLAYLGFDGQMDSNILIRTITAGRGWCQIPVGGGVVAPSRPRDEYEETRHKARGLVEVVSV